MFNKDLEKIMREIKVLEAGLKSYLEKSENKQYDKLGLEFSCMPDNFCSVRLSIGLISWAGEYGRSVCSTIFGSLSEDVFGKAFRMYLNQNKMKILESVLTIMKDAARELKDDEVRLLQKEISQLNEL